MKKTKLFPIALLVGVLGLSGCGNSSASDPSVLGKNLEAISSNEAMIVAENAVARENSVTKMHIKSSSLSDSSITPESLGELRSSSSDVTNTDISFYSDSIYSEVSEKSSAKMSDGFAEENDDSSGHSTIWYGAPLDTSLTDVVSLYVNEYAEYASGDSYDETWVDYGTFCSLESVEASWSFYRASYVTDNLVSSINYDSDYSYAKDGSYVVGYKYSLTASTSPSLFATGSTDVVVKTTKEIREITKYAQNSELGWVVSSSYQSEKSSYLTDLFGKELDSAFVYEFNESAVTLEYASALTAKGNLPAAAEYVSVGAYVNLFDSSAAFQSENGMLHTNEYVMSFEVPDYANQSFSLTKSFNAGDLIAISNIANQEAETPVYEVWGWSNLTSKPSAFIADDAKIADHNLIEMKQSGIYSIVLELDSNSTNVLDFEISYIG